MNRIFIIGGTGFLGYNLSMELSNSNSEIYVIGRNLKTKRVFSNNTIYLSGNCYDLRFIKDTMRKSDMVIYSVSNTLDESEIVNIEKMFKLLVKIEISKLIVMSSGGAVYGNTDTSLKMESEVCSPISSYGKFNLKLEKVCIKLYKSYNLPVIIARPSNVYGEWQLPYSGQGFISTILASLVDKKNIYIYGKTGKVRDYIYIKDFVRAIKELLYKGNIGNCYNIGSSVGYGNFDLLRIIFSLFPNLEDRSRIFIAPPREIDVDNNILDCTKIYSQVNWKCDYDIQTGLKKTLRWIKRERMWI